MPASRTDLAAILQEAVAIAHEAARILVDRSRLPLEELGTREKTEADYVTRVDLELEEFFRQRLGAILPAAGFLGEETGLRGDPEGLLWVVDPVDGTSNFSRGLQPFGFSMALLDAREPVLGILAVPGQGWLLDAARGLGTRFQGRLLRLADRELGPRSLVGAGFLRATPPPAWLDPLLASGIRIRFFGSAVTHLAGVATGRLDLSIQGFGHIWDLAGAVVVLEEAGARSVRLDGSHLAPFRDAEMAGGHADCLAGTPTIVAQALELLGQELSSPRC